LATLQAEIDSLRAQVERLQAEKMEAVDRLVGGVSHGFNNLLMVILGHSEVALAELEKEGDARAIMLARLIGEIRRAGEQGMLLTRQMLTFSRKHRDHPQLINPRTMIANMRSVLRRTAGEAVGLACDIADGNSTIRIDPDHVQQCLHNLVTNARDAMPVGGQLAIRVKDVVLDGQRVSSHMGNRAGPHVLIEVSDTGHGMSEEVQSHLFEPFFTTKPVDKGTGLGLTTVYGIITHVGGAIGVQSRVNEGTTFRLYIPAVEMPVAEHAHEAQTTSPATRRRTILVCEDQTQLRRLITRQLAAAGYDVLDAPNGRAALQLAAAHPEGIDLLITDLIMPGMNGCDLANAFVEQSPDVKILLMSGYTAGILDNHSIGQRGVTLLRKPFGLNALIETVDRLMESKP
jgi:nitrogen-specific signal transduction histidine kinase/ActR/RegA family two-component response regulator